MRRRAAVGVGLAVGVLVAIAFAVFGIGSSAAHASVGSATPARLFVSAKEFSLVMSRQGLRPGHAVVQLYNAGEDAHDLRLKRVGGSRTLHIPETTPGNVAQINATLRSGTWKLWCSLPGHAKAGMRATLVVRP